MSTPAIQQDLPEPSTPSEVSTSSEAIMSSNIPGSSEVKTPLSGREDISDDAVLEDQDNNGVEMEKQDGDQMTPAKSNSGGKKRKNDAPVPAAKRTKAERKKEEKENRSKTQSPNSSIDGSIAGTSSAMTTSGEASRRKTTKPVKLCDLQKTLTVNTDGDTIMAPYKNNDKLMIVNCRFRIGNVVANRNAKLGKTKVVKRVMPEIEESLEELIKKKYEQNDHHELFSVNFTKICSWANNVDAQNFATDAAAVQSYTLIVDQQDNVKIIENGLASVSFKNPSSSKNDDLRIISNLKNVTVTSQEYNNAKYIYYAAVVQRMTTFTEKRASRIPANAKPSDDLLDPATLKREIGVGCIRMYAKGKPNKMLDGVQRMILVSHDDSPVKEMLRVGKEPESLINWMKNAANLVTLDELNTNKQDAHIFRIIFETYREELEPTIEATKGPAPPVARANRTDLALKLKKKQCRVFARFPFLEMENSADVSTRTFDEEYFQEGDKITHICDWQFFKPPFDRTVAITKRTAAPEEYYEETDESSDDGEYSDTRNRAPGNRKVYGLDFVQPAGHTPFRKDIHRRRQGNWVPPLDAADGVPADDDERMDDGSERKCETFTLNNPQLMTALEMRFRKMQCIPPECRIPGSEMSVVHVPITEEQKRIHNTKLAAAKVGKDVKAHPRRQNPKYDPNAPNADLHGRPIPGFCEFFFPQKESELYDILLRNYLSEVGCRPGSFSAEWLSRIMTGFVTANHEVLLEHNLENIFLKQLQMMGLKSPDWQMCHFKVPYNKFYDFKRDWLAKKKQTQPNQS